MAQNFELGNLVWKITGDTAGFNKNLKQANKTAGGFGSTLKKAFSLAIIAVAIKKIGDVGKALVKAASNAEETQNKFDVVFKDVADGANKSAIELANGYGLARTEAQGLLADTADLLQGFGIQSEESLNLSTNVNKLAADLASFTNFSGGAAGASQALTKALLGETESAKALGIAITQAELKKLAEEQGLVFKELTRGEKALLTYELAVRQSQNAIGDFARSQNSFANQSRIAEARVKDLKVILGESLLPIANVGVTLFNDFALVLIDAAEGIKDFVTSAEGAEVIGKVLGNIAGGFAVAWEIAKELFDGLKTALGDILQPFKDLQTETEGTGLFVSILAGAVNLLTAGIRVAGLIIKGAITQFINLGKVFLSVGKLAGNFFDLITFKSSFEEFKSGIDAVGSSFVNLADGYVNSVKDVVVGVFNEVQDFGANTERITENIKGAFNKVSDSIGGRVTTALVDAGKGQDKLAQSTDDTIESLEEQTKVLEEMQKITDSYSQKLTDLGKTENQLFLESLENEKTLALGRVEGNQQAIDAVNAYYDAIINEELEEQRNAQEQASLDNFKSVWNERLSIVSSVLGGIGTAISSLADTELKKISESEKAELAKLDNLVISEEEKEKKREEIEEKFAKKKASIKTKEAKADKARSIFEIAVNTASAIVEALPNIPLSIIAGITGAAQLAATISTPIPKFATGGIVPQFPGVPKTGDKQLGLLNPSEEVIPESDPRHRNNRGQQAVINVTQNNTLNTDTRANLEKVVRMLLPIIRQEEIRIG